MRITEEALSVVKVNEKTKLKVRNMGKVFYVLTDPIRSLLHAVADTIYEARKEWFGMFLTETLATHYVANMLIDELVDSGKGSIVVAFGEPNSYMDDENDREYVSASESLNSDSVYVTKDIINLTDHYKHRESLKYFRDQGSNIKRHEFRIDGYLLQKKLGEYFKKYKGVEFEDCSEELKGRRDLWLLSCGFRLTLVKK